MLRRAGWGCCATSKAFLPAAPTAVMLPPYNGQTPFKSRVIACMAGPAACESHEQTAHVVMHPAASTPKRSWMHTATVFRQARKPVAAKKRADRESAKEAKTEKKAAKEKKAKKPKKEKKGRKKSSVELGKIVVDI